MAATLQSLALSDDKHQVMLLAGGRGHPLVQRGPGPGHGDMPGLVERIILSYHVKRKPEVYFWA